jgi:hypothetical protein
MTTIRVPLRVYLINLRYNFGIILITMSIVFQTRSAFFNLLLIGTTIIFLYRLHILASYRLELSRGVIREYYKGRMREFVFEDIMSLDCQLFTFKFPNKLSILQIVLYDGTKIDFRTSVQASLPELRQWVQTNYSHAYITKRFNFFAGNIS